MLNNQDNHPLYAAINRKLAGVLETSPAPPAWQDAWLQLGPESTEEERLAFNRAIQDAGSVSADAGSERSAA